MLIKILLAALTGASFMGLCGLVRDRLGIDDSAAPLVVSCGVVAALMLSGMARALFWCWLALQAAGLAAFAWVFVVRRRCFSGLVVAFMLAQVLYVALAYRHANFVGNDTISHWAVAAKYLIRTDRFPDAGSSVIYFRSYPLGAACFIYYLCRGIGVGPGQFLAAQSLFSWFALLPLLGCVRKNRRIGALAAALAMVCLTGTRFYHYSLVVEPIQAHLAIGGTLIACRNRENPRRAIAAMLPVIVALAFIKSSGIFFAVLLCGLLALAIKRGAGEGRGALRALLAGLLAAGIAFMLWQVHVKFTFGATIGKHAVSLGGYAEKAGAKSLELILSIASQMLARLLRPGPFWICLAVYAATLLLALRSGEDRPEWLRRWRQAAALSFGTSGVWYAMIFLMYVFSMADYEAEIIVAIDRYEYSGVLYALGVMAAFILEYVDARAWKISAPLRVLCRVGLALATGFAVLCTVFGVEDVLRLRFPAREPGLFDQLADIHEAYGVEEGRRYIFFSEYSSYLQLLYTNGTKYEFFSNDMLEIYHFDTSLVEGEEVYYGYSRLSDEVKDYGPIYDLEAFLAENFDDYDYLLIYAREPGFEAVLSDFLDGYRGDTQVCVGY